MRRLPAVLVLASLCFPLLAAERAPEGEGMGAKAMAAASQARLADHGHAPFRAARDPIPRLFVPDALPAAKPQGACDSHARALCYDSGDRRIVYRPARDLMPAIEGMKAESISLRRGRVTFKYSFR